MKLLREMQEWCLAQMQAGLPCRVGDYFRAHDLCPLCKARAPLVSRCERCSGSGAFVELVCVPCSPGAQDDTAGDITGSTSSALASLLSETVRLFLCALDRRDFYIVEKVGGHPPSAAYMCKLERLLEEYDNSCIDA